MSFDISPPAPSRILETPVKRIEGVANGYIDVLVSLPKSRIAIYDDLAPRHLEIDTYIVETVFTAVPMWRTNDDTAGHNTGMEFTELCGPLDNPGTHSLRGGYIAESDLRGDRVHRCTWVS